MRLLLIALLLCFIAPSQLFADSAVAVAPVKESRLTESLNLTGNVIASKEVDIAAEISASVAEIMVESGDNVSAGDVLLQLRDLPIKWQLESARAVLQENKAAVKLAQLEQKRLKQLLDKQSVAVDVYDKAVAQLQQAQASVSAQHARIAELQDRFDRHKIVAPFSGAITQRSVEKGSWINAGDVLFHLVSLDQLHLEVNLPQRYFDRLNDTDTEWSAVIITDKENYPAQIERIIPFADSSRSFSLWLTIDNQQRAFIPGMSTQARLQWQMKTAQLTLPDDALIRKANGDVLVWKTEIRDGKTIVSPAPVSVIASNQGISAVLSKHLKANDLVVVRGNETLQPQQPVSVINPPDGN